VSAAEHVRREWEQNARELEGHAPDRALYERLLGQLEIVTDELRRRVGQTFTLAELERSYREADRWAADALAETGGASAWPTSLSVVVGAAFHAYARGASDYEP
jgi:hypothetical protein